VVMPARQFRDGLLTHRTDAILGYPCKAGHPLEGSCQEVKRPPYPPLGIFFGRGTLHGISLPICRFARARVFSGFGIDRTMATHQTPIRIKAR
jgi:hypothetical protein